ncbi:MAG TPA: BLUF domain-containing protein [Phycisphaerales bacterium]|nr:BLUF domain-containing protein [Phycisphaerales bacterium]
MHLQRLSYCSTRSETLTDEELLSGLLLPAQARNKRDGITGCLWCGRLSFVHVIEGGPDAVHDLMVRIADDPRHSRLAVLSNSSTDTRLFADWALKWVRGRDCLVVDGLAETAVAAIVTPAGAVRTWRQSEAARHGPVVRDPRPAQFIMGELVRADPTIY